MSEEDDFGQKGKEIFEKIEKIGSGTYGVVYKGFKKNKDGSKQIVAIKIMNNENVGKETAYDIKVYVSGLPIENNLYDFVKKVFVDLKDSSFVLKGGAKRYFYISPSIMEYNIKLPWKEKRTKDEINNWLKEYDSKAITINGKYNNKYPIKERFTIRDFNILGTFQIPSSIESIAGVVSDMDTYTLNEIKDSLNNIADKIENK